MSKKIIRLTENDLTRIVKKVLNEVKSIEISPFILSISGGLIKITNTKFNESRTYKLWKDAFIDIPLTVVDFPEGGSKITVSAVGKSQTDDLDKEVLNDILTKHWDKNQKEIPYTTKKGTDLIFEKQ